MRLFNFARSFYDSKIYIVRKFLFCAARIGPRRDRIYLCA